MEENLREAVREKYDYTDFLRRFMVMGETIQVNDDEFDYIYYNPVSFPVFMKRSKSSSQVITVSLRTS